MKTGIDFIAEERARQVAEEGFDASHDAQHDHRELLAAGICYLSHAHDRGWLVLRQEEFDVEDGLTRYKNEPAPALWPWDEKWWKPKDPARDIVRGGALIAATLDRLITPPREGVER